MIAFVLVLLLLLVWVLVMVYDVYDWVGGLGLSGYAMIPSVLLPVCFGLVWWCFVG